MKNSNRKVSAERNNLTIIWSVFLTLFIIEAFLLVLCRTEIRKIGYDISEQISKNKIIKEKERKLKVELASLKSPERIASIANSLGLIMPKQEQITRMP
ncbi:MAG: cell division protein FtsL [Deltaproteobacteria bacterium]|nr:cell division protein FtsL [Deltaproteobacteria bacterium]